MWVTEQTRWSLQSGRHCFHAYTSRLQLQLRWVRARVSSRFSCVTVSFDLPRWHLARLFRPGYDGIEIWLVSLWCLLDVVQSRHGVSVKQSVITILSSLECLQLLQSTNWTWQPNFSGGFFLENRALWHHLLPEKKKAQHCCCLTWEQWQRSRSGFGFHSDLSTDWSCSSLGLVSAKWGVCCMDVDVMTSQQECWA